MGGNGRDDERQTPLDERVKNPVERQRLLHKRIGDLLQAPRGSYGDEKSAQALWENLILLCGAGAISGTEGPSYAQRVRDALAALQGLKADEEGCAEGARKLAAVVEKHSGVRRAQAVCDIPAEMPRRLMWVYKHRGSVMSEGSVCLLAGEGGVSKTTLALQVGLHAAAKDPLLNGGGGGGEDSPLCGALEIVPGKVVVVSYEDQPRVCSWRLRRLARYLDRGEEGPAHDAFRRVFVLGLSGRPLFGPPDGGSYNIRPAALPGWMDLSRAVEEIEPVLIIIDPALSAYVGEANATAPVREFLGKLGELASPIGAGVLVLAHSTKMARRSSDAYDPGHIGGSAAWHDGVRGALVLTQQEGETTLRVSKSNYGPAFFGAKLKPMRPPGVDDGLVGFEFDGEWVDKPDGAAAAQQNGGGVSYGDVASATGDPIGAVAGGQDDVV